MRCKLFCGSEREVAPALGVFVRGLLRRPGVYGVPPGETAEALLRVRVFEALLERPGRAAGVRRDRAARKRAMAEAQRACRKLAAHIDATAGVSDADRDAIGLPLHDRGRRRIVPPKRAA